MVSARRSLRFPSEDVVDSGEGEQVWGGVGLELRQIADRMVGARVGQYQVRSDYYATTASEADSSNLLYSFLVMAFFKYICNLFTSYF